MQGRTLVVAATDVLAKGFVAISERTAPDGRPTNALFGVARAVRSALAFKEPDLAVAVVDPAPTGFADTLAAQVPELPALLEAHGLPVVTAAEPHHVAASYVAAALALGHDVVVVASDKRFAQLVSDRVWWYDPYKDARYTPDMVRKRFDVPPEVVAGWLALVGDDDALPGVKGIGRKGATDLVTAYGSVAEALPHVDEISGRTGNALRAGLDEARLQLERATLRTDASLPRPLTDLPFHPPTVSDLNAVYADLGLFRLLEADGASRVDTVVCDRPEAIRDALQGLGTGPVAMYAVTEDPSPVRGGIVGLALAPEEGDALYVPIRGEVDPALRAWLGDASRPKVGHDTKQVVVTMARLGVPVAGIVGDSEFASHLTSPSGLAPHDLEQVALVRLQRPVAPVDEVRGVGRGRKPWANLPVPEVAAFAGGRAALAGDLWASFADTVQPDLLGEYLALAEVLVRMERVGMGVDVDDLERSAADFEAIRAELEQEVYALAGHELNLNSSDQLGTVLFEELGLPVIRRTKTGWSTAADVLERLEGAHPIVPLVSRWRQLRRLQDSWITALIACVDPDGRVRSTFDAGRSFSGRLVNAAPDLGRVPGRTPEMARIRHAFVPRPGHTLLSVDYNQLGLYVLAHLSRDPALVDPLTRGDDMHVLTASAVLELPVDQIGPAQRQTGKVVNFATFAGQGASALALQLGLSAQDTAVLIERFDRRYAGVRAFQDEQLRLARERGWIVTIAGRHWPIGDLDSLDTQLRAYAERLARRATHEGSVSDVTRRGLLHADHALRDAGLAARPLLQILDEVLFEVPDAELHEAARVAAAAMEGAFDLVVPLKVGCKAGPNWSELQRL